MAEERITLIVRDAMVDCRRDQLWTRLMRGSPPLSYSEFVHLTTLVQHETLDEVRDILTFLILFEDTRKTQVCYFLLEEDSYVMKGFVCPSIPSILFSFLCCSSLLRKTVIGCGTGLTLILLYSILCNTVPSSYSSFLSQFTKTFIEFFLNTVNKIQMLVFFHIHDK